uniref:ACT domain-containing protein ACR n=1 Tax=Ananas comosus var. bracteatus TaxID=296719 RepID=A0A6V7Q154_ANACO|nr:unnamed protein product [Ananas comosus var. bracteatus]
MALAARFFLLSSPRSLASSASASLPPLPRSPTPHLGLVLRRSRSDRLDLPDASLFSHGSISHGGGSLPRKIRWIGPQFSGNSAETLGSSSSEPDEDTDSVPMPIVLIDQDSDPDATIVQLSFGDRLGALLDTMKALTDLGLHVTKGSVTANEFVVRTKFFITQMGRKIVDPDILERIRLTIISNLLKYHPESSEKLAMGEIFGIKPPVKLDVELATHIHLEHDGPKRSLLYIETADRPGLLLEIIKVITDENLDVESAEIDTEGLIAKEKFHVSYRGAALTDPLSQLLVNCLRYYLRRPETDEGSY